MSGPFILVPITVTNAMISSSTATEPGVGETVWDPTANYVTGEECILPGTHRVYTNLIAGVNATSPHLATGGPTPRWLDTRATNKFAAFDDLPSTPTSVDTVLTYVFRPGLFNAIALYGLDGAALSISEKNAPGGAVVFTYASDLTDPPLDHYDYYFGRIRPINKILCQGLTPYADPELTITITAAAGVKVKAGMIVIGDLRSLVSADSAGGTQYGSAAEPITNSYIGYTLGVATIKRRAPSTNLDIRVEVPKEDSDSALQTLQDVLDVPVAFIGSDVPNFLGLNVFGLVSGRVSYDGPNHSILSIQVKGFMDAYITA